MTERPSCKNCEEALVKVKHGYQCPNCHTLYTEKLEMVWDATKKHQNPGAATWH